MCSNVRVEIGKAGGQEGSEEPWPSANGCKRGEVEFWWWRVWWGGVSDGEGLQGEVWGQSASCVYLYDSDRSEGAGA